MKRHARWWVLGVVFGIAGCAVGSEDPVGEPLDEQAAELGTNEGSGLDRTQVPASGAVGEPADLVKVGSGDPGGPTPYPWRTSDDPSGGPTPYPWDDETDDPGDGTQPAGNGSGAGTQQAQTTSAKH